MIVVTCEVPTYEIDARRDVQVPVRVESHWSNNRMVILKVGGQSVIVQAHDLVAAVTNATNR